MKNNKEIVNLPSPAIGGLSVYLSQIKNFNVRRRGRIYVS